MLVPNVFKFVVVTVPNTLGVVLLDPKVNVALGLLTPKIGAEVVVEVEVVPPNEIFPNAGGVFCIVVE